jgi:hypothetical protein
MNGSMVKEYSPMAMVVDQWEERKIHLGDSIYVIRVICGILIYLWNQEIKGNGHQPR